MAQAAAHTPEMYALIIIRNLVGFAYGAAFWGEYKKKDFIDNPLTTAFWTSVNGAFALLASSACAEFGMRPFSDFIVIAALGYSAYQKRHTLTN
jgi:hypothetical protein